MAKKKPKKRKKTFQPKSAISDEIFLPNHSGEHNAGTISKRPIKDIDIPNKKYVDDAIDAIPEDDDSGKLDIDGSNADGNVDIGDNAFSASDFFGQQITSSGTSFLFGSGDGFGSIAYMSIAGIAEEEWAIRPYMPSTIMDLGSGGTTVMDRNFRNLYLTDNAFIDTMTISSGSITDSTGAIDFDDENLGTAGTITTGSSYLGPNSHEIDMSNSGYVDFLEYGALMLRLNLFTALADFQNLDIITDGKVEATGGVETNDITSIYTSMTINTPDLEITGNVDLGEHDIKTEGGVYTGSLHAKTAYGEPEIFDVNQQVIYDWFGTKILQFGYNKGFFDFNEHLSIEWDMRGLYAYDYTYGTVEVIDYSDSSEVRIPVDLKVEGVYKSSDGSAGWTGSFTNGDGDIVTVKDGIITDVSMPV